MGRRHSDLLLIFKEINRQSRPCLDLDNVDDYRIFIRILKLMECTRLTLDHEEQSRLLIRVEQLNYLKQNPPQNEEERLLKNYFMKCDRNMYDVI